jgi:hypothetical protein
MGTPIRILLVEDQADDVELVLRHLRSSGYQPTLHRVETAEEMRAALAREPWDVVISDYSLPSFHAPDALALLHATGNDLPFIVLTGSIGEDRATAIMKAGAHDFILKDQLARLTASIERAMGDARVRADHRDALVSLRSTNQELATLIDASPLAIITLGPTGVVRRWNSAAQRLFGWLVADVIGRPLPAVPRESQIETASMFSDVLRGRSFTAVELRWQRHDRALVDIALSMAPLRSGGDHVDGIIVLASDMTERKNLEKQLQQTQKMEIVGRLAGGIAHDFNNLLTVINGRCQMLLGRLAGQDASRRDAELILETGERAARLTRQLLAFSRRQVFQVRDLDLNRAVSDMRKMLDTLIGEDVELITRLEPGLASVRTDPSQLEQVVLNLAINARDAMPRGGRLVIATARVGSEELSRRGIPLTAPCVQLSVSDTGVGIDEKTRAHLFEPFFTTKQQGTGLGLSTVDGIVRQSGGFIRVDTELGRGTTFLIYLPGAQTTRPDEESSNLNLDALRLGTTVLVVEDNDAVRDLVHEALSSYGYQVLSAANWPQALEAVENRQGKIDLLLTDLIMPQVSGREVADRLKPMCPGMKVLYMSGYTDNILSQHGGMVPAMSLVQKPFTPRKLAKHVRRALERN